MNFIFLLVGIVAGGASVALMCASSIGEQRSRRMRCCEYWAHRVTELQEQVNELQARIDAEGEEWKKE